MNVEPPKWLLILASFVSSAITAPFTGTTSQLDLSYISQFVMVKYNVLDNLYKEDKFKAVIILSNAGSSIIRPGSWSIYFNHPNIILPVRNSSNTLEIHAIRAMFHQLKLAPSTSEWHPGTDLRVSFVARIWSVARTDVMPNWYVTAPGLEPRLLTNTADERLGFVGHFNEERKWKRFAHDVFNPPTISERYESHHIMHGMDAREARWRVIPSPYQAKIGLRPTIDLSNRNWNILVLPKDRALLPAAKLLKEKINLPITEVPGHQHLLGLTLGKVEVPSQYSHVIHEAYQLKVDEKSLKISITVNAVQGAFNAVQTLLSLADRTLIIPDCDIVDFPRFPYRGVHLDVVRNFRTDHEVRTFIDNIAMYKLNKLHLHLADDEGWRIDIPDIPQLTQVGSQRCHDLTETKCILPFLGSGPTPGYPGSGYYTVQQYQSILKYAKSRGVEVIPEIDVPGHSHAAIKAIHARHTNMVNNGTPIQDASKYDLWDPKDQSIYLTNQHFNDNAINPCIESPYTFMETVISSLVRHHEPYQPLKTFHFGGDEVGIGAWSGSPACVRFLNEHADYGTIKNLKRYFAKRVAGIAERHGLAIAAWEDGFYGERMFAKKDVSRGQVVGYAWNNVWEWGGGGRAYQMANNGYKVVMSPATHLYLDHPYAADPEERGLYWAARFTNTFKVFTFMPHNLYEHIETLVSGERINSRESICHKNNVDCPPLVQKSNIIGIEGSLWSETHRTFNQVNSAAFPRLIAVAERAWHEAAWETISDKQMRDLEQAKDWGQFAGTVGHKELLRLDERGVEYHLNPPGARVEEGRLFTNTPFPGLSVEYSEDMGRTWRSANNRPLLDHNLMIVLRSKSADGRRSSKWIALKPGGYYSMATPVSRRTSLPSIILLSAALCFSFAVLRYIVAKRHVLWSRTVRYIMILVNKKLR